VRLPAKRVPDAVERWIRHYEDNRNEGEPFNAFVDRVGTAEFEELVRRDLALPPEFSLESMAEFMDWSRDVPFEVIRGEGECAV
jgi:sulfite reductase (ferredoxin)